MRKPLAWPFMILGGILGAFAVALVVSALLYSPRYMARVLTNGESKVTDWRFFPARVIEKSHRPYSYALGLDPKLDELDIRFTDAKGKTRSAPLLSVLEDNGTTSFIAVRNDRVICEKYINGYTKDAVNTSFSSVKSIDSLLIGLAIEDGYIQSTDQSMGDFIPEFKDTPFEDITIKNLLMMRSKIAYEEGLAWFTDDAKTYYMPDLRDLALRHMSIDRDYAGQFHYNNYHPLLLGIILERSTGQKVSDYFGDKIWKKIGAEHDASWSLDSKETQFEKMESGLNFHSIDYIKIGSMLLHNGKWNGEEVIGKDWISKSVFAPAPLTPADSDSLFLADRKVGYQYMWYSIENEKGGYDFFASGKYGQVLYVSPENHTVILRTGTDTGEVAWWPEVLRQVADYQ